MFNVKLKLLKTTKTFTNRYYISIDLLLLSLKKINNSVSFVKKIFFEKLLYK